jgi:uncharacterized protein YccT (UPF0319 family)
MHSSVLQNEDYIKFSDENTVEVIALGRLDEAITKNESKAAEFDTKDDDGKPVKRMMEYPSLSKDEMLALDRSKAASYNNTGKIPFTCVVNPWDEAEMQRFSGGQSAKTIMEAALAAKKTLNEAKGPSLSRPVIKKFDLDAKKLLEAMPKAGTAKTLADFNKVVKGLGKDATAMKAKTDKVHATIIEAATKDLDDADAALGTGDTAAAKKILDKLAPALKGTDLEARAKELVAKLKAAAAPAEPAK